MFDYRHTFRDPLHGFIAISPEERALIDSLVLQRLRRIRQLGTSYLVYHGAEQSRFGHSLGVLEVVTRALHAIQRRKPEIFGTAEEFARILQIARLAGLLHDVGHAPFSHASEEVFPTKASGASFKHEDYTEALILNSELAPLIKKGFDDKGIKVDDIVDVFRDPAALGAVGILLQDLLAGELDADRMDYLARDSMFAGVTYGHYDVGRLLDSMTAVKDDRDVLHLAVMHNGLQALEAFLLARYFMFLQVYLHPLRRFFDRALTNFLRSVLPGGTYPEPTKWKEFLDWDDIKVMDLALKQAGTNQWAKCLVERDHWKAVEELDTGEPGLKDGVKWGMAASAVITAFGDDVFLDNAKARTAQRTGPRPYITASAEKEERPRILVLDRTGTNASRVEDVSNLVSTIAQRDILITRLYAKPDKLVVVKDKFREALEAN